MQPETVGATPLEVGPSSALGPDCKALQVAAELLSDTSEVGTVSRAHGEVGTATVNVLRGFESPRRPKGFR